MTSQEKRLLVVGTLSGALFVGAVSAGLFYRFQRTHPSDMPSTPPATTETAPPLTAATNGQMQQSAAQLSPEEQAKIGLQTVPVRRESITEDIVAIGRVEEPETAIAT